MCAAGQVRTRSVSSRQLYDRVFCRRRGWFIAQLEPKSVNDKDLICREANTKPNIQQCVRLAASVGLEFWSGGENDAWHPCRQKAEHRS